MTHTALHSIIQSLAWLIMDPRFTWGMLLCLALTALTALDVAYGAAGMATTIGVSLSHALSQRICNDGDCHRG